MKRHINYFKYVVRHKWFVFLAGIKLGVPIMSLIIHDWDKFTPAMWTSYANTFYLPNGESQYNEHLDFDMAWNGHEKQNKHHWQYWVLIKDNGDFIPLPIPDKHRREMLADWKGAGKAQGFPDTLEWYSTRTEMHKMLENDTKQWIDDQLGFSG